MMDLYYPNRAWLCLEREAFDQLHDYKRTHGIPTWEQTLEELVSIAGPLERSPRRGAARPGSPIAPGGNPDHLMNLELAKKVADSVLYEGYLLYPYRASAVKNRQRFNFGVLLPPAYAQAQKGNDAWKMRTECLVEGDNPRFDMRVRFLQIIVREAGRLLRHGGQACNARRRL